MKKIVISTLITLVLLLGLSTTVFAQTEGPVVVNVVTGTVVEVSQLDGTVTVDVDGEAVVFAVPAGFDFTGVRTGDTVEVETATDENGQTS
ncbi:MAG TPA: hypothetical protein VFF68_06460, partial [Anaerolineaceae bacterium]|nr:hypothetical protein [Anaerolineaceae bacterium]